MRDGITTMIILSRSYSITLHRPTRLTLYSLSLDFLVNNACVYHRPRHWVSECLGEYGLTCPPTLFGVWCHIADVITRVKF